MLGCGGSKGIGGPQAKQFSPEILLNDQDNRVRVQGTGFTGTVKVMLWAGTPERLLRQVAVTDLKVHTDTALTFTLPAGALPGKYMVVCQTAKLTRFSKTLVSVVEREGNVPPKVLRVQGQLYSDVPSRIYLVGQGMGEVDGVSLSNASGKARLKHLRAYSGARLGASLEEDTLAPGTYYLRLGRGSDWSDGPYIKVTESGFAKDGALCFSTYFLVLGGVFFLGLFLAYRQGDVGLKTVAQRRNLVMLMSGLVFTFVMLGTVQLGLAWWR